MIETRNIYNDRIAEIEFYYSIMQDFENGDISGNSKINTTDNPRLFRIMKSNFLLMLYNLVESTISSGIKEIYSLLYQDQCSYDDLIEEVKKIWRESKIRQIYKDPSSKIKTYHNTVKEIINDITNHNTIQLSKNAINISGNLDANEIKRICDIHGIRYRVEGSHDDYLKDVKDKRNALAHGSVSFGECSRDLTLHDMRTIKDSVFLFLDNILEGMEKYCSEKQYRISAS